jgi:hypothetical protein
MTYQAPGIELVQLGGSTNQAGGLAKPGKRLFRTTHAAYRFKHHDGMIPTAIIARVISIQF